MARTCAFCGGGKPWAAEHAIPQWISRLIVPEGPVLHRHPLIPEWEARYFETKTGQVCRDCNSGWMSRLEVAAKSIVTDMLFGRPTTIRSGQRRVIAAWAYKTALVFQLCMPEANPVPPSHYRTLFADGQPPKATRLDLFRFAIEQEIVAPDPDGLTRATFCRAAHLDLQTRQGVDVDGYAIAFYIANFGVYVFGWNDDREVFDMGGPGVEGIVVRLWPYRGTPVVWPPSLAVNAAGVDNLITDIRG